MSTMVLNATVRENSGKAEAGRTRRTGQVPCVMYGVEKTPILLNVDNLEMSKLLASSHSIIDVNYDGKVQGAVIREVQYHPVKGSIMHVDFLRVKAGQEITISVPLRFVGNSIGVKAGGVFQEIKAELEITTLPKNLPDVIEVDISNLNINEAIHVKDLHSEAYTIEENPEDTVCSVIPPRKTDAYAETGAEGGEFGELESEGKSEPEVITAKRTEEE